MSASLASKITLAVTSAGAASVIYYVHYRQVEDRQQLHQGIVRDLERQQQKKIENLYRLEQQKELTKLYRKEQAKDNAAATE